MKIAKLCLLMFALWVAVPLLAQGSAQANDQASAGGAVSGAVNAAANAATQPPEAIPAMPAPRPRTPPVNEEERIARRVRHALVMLPYYSIWDWLAFRVQGRSVELQGYAYSLGLKRDAVSAVKRIDGVQTVIDHIQQLPPSPTDDRIRRQVARAIFGWGNLSRYAAPPVPSIHIIVEGGRVWMEGVVDSQPDKDAAGLRANGVAGVFQVSNELRVGKD
jgi:BON domain